MFKQPLHVGELVTFLANVNPVGRSSMEIGIKVVAENIRDKVVRHTNRCCLTLVALSENGKPAPVPPSPWRRRCSGYASRRSRLRKQAEEERRAQDDHLANQGHASGAPACS